MKYLLTLFLSVPLLLQAQVSETITVAPKKTNLIIVKGVTIKEAVPLLLSNGYIIDKIDEVYKFVSTKPKTLRKSTTSVSLQMVEKDSTLSITGVADMNMKVNVGLYSADVAAAQIENRGQRGSGLRESFEEMNRVAKAFNKEIEYQVK